MASSFENLVNYERYKTQTTPSEIAIWFENLVNYERYKTLRDELVRLMEFENLVNYERYKTDYSANVFFIRLRTL